MGMGDTPISQPLDWEDQGQFSVRPLTLNQSCKASPAGKQGPSQHSSQGSVRHTSFTAELGNRPR